MDAELIKQTVREAFKEELKDFYIDRETHYKQHEWLGKLIKLSDHCTNTVWKTIINSIVIGTVGLVALGFVCWIGGKIK